MGGVRKRSVTIGGHRTSFSVEDEFFEELERLAAAANRSLASLVAEIDRDRAPDANLSSAIRLHILRVLKGGTDRP